MDAAGPGPMSDATRKSLDAILRDPLGSSRTKNREADLLASVEAALSRIERPAQSFPAPTSKDYFEPETSPVFSEPKDYLEPETSPVFSEPSGNSWGCISSLLVGIKKLLLLPWQLLRWLFGQAC